MKYVVLTDTHVGAVRPGEACPPGGCSHCRAGRPATPVEAGDPRDLSMALTDVDEALRVAAPPAFHRPEWMAEHGQWRCAACWTVAWPCPVADAHPTYLQRAFLFELAVARRHHAVIVPSQQQG